MDIRSDKPLLTIAIPTFNRSSWLDLCLSQVVMQSKSQGTAVEILVSNNNSTDNSEEVVKKYIASGSAIYYIKNTENIGPDRNLLQAFVKANGRYVLVMGDDDVLLDGALERILNILKRGDYGVVFLNSYGFASDFIAERPRSYLHGYTVFTNVNEFIRKASYLLTFISVNIIRKEFVDEDLLYQLVNSNLVQLGWTFSALLKSEKNVFVNEYSVASRMFNSGGYRLCEVFALKFNQISDIFIARGIDKKQIDIINKRMLFKLFPAQIIRARLHRLKLIPEDYFRTLYPLYKTYANFWLFTIPAIYLPITLSNFFYRVAKAIRHYTPFR